MINKKDILKISTCHSIIESKKLDDKYHLRYLIIWYNFLLQFN